MEVVTFNVNKAHYSFRSGSTNHLINKDLPLCVIEFNKGEIKENEDGSIQSIGQTASGFPKMTLQAASVDNPALKGQVVIYGDSIPVFLGLQFEKTDKGYKTVASFLAKSNKWISSTGEAVTGEAQDENNLELTVKELKAKAKDLGASDREISKATTKKELVELIQDLQITA